MNVNVKVAIQAVLDGKQIQCQNGATWRDLSKDVLSTLRFITTYPEFVYRTKPEPQVFYDVIRIGNNGGKLLDMGSCSTLEDLKKRWPRPGDSYVYVKLTIDGDNQTVEIVK
jgi:hypothetical protein